MPRLLPILLVCCIVGSSVGASFAQTVGPTPQKVLGIYVQIAVRDKAGTLVSYLETSNVKISDPGQFNQLVDQNIGQFKESTVNAGGQDIEILQVNDTFVHSSPTIVSLNLISLNTSSGPKQLVVADHDGFPVVPGDKMTTYWTIHRTAGP